MKWTLLVVCLAAVAVLTNAAPHWKNDEDEEREDLLEEIEDLDEGFRDKCFPLPPKNGLKRCNCEEDDGTTNKYSGNDCKMVPDHAAHAGHGHDHPAGENVEEREDLLDEIEDLDEGFRDKCFPLPPKNGLKRCNCEEDDGTTNKYSGDDCKMEPDHAAHAGHGHDHPAGENVHAEHDHSEHHGHTHNKKKRHSKRALKKKDPIYEKAKSDYGKVVQELKNRFHNYKENCFPRPRGCLCVIGERNGRELTKRIKTDEGGCRKDFKGKV